MITPDQSTRKATFASEEVIGKVFIALGSGMRQCLICGCTFTKQGAAEHARTVCHPSEGKSGLDGGNDHANR